MRPLLILLVAFVTAPLAQAESGGIGIEVVLDKDRIPRVTIVSSWKRNNAKNVTMREAVKKITAARNNRSIDFVGIVAEDVALRFYLPLLEAVVKNPNLDLLFVDGTTSDGISKNIRKLIEQDAVVIR